jgi:hypothetical protein
MNTDNKYNGWTNYATWRINLEMFDGCNTYYSADIAKEYVEDAIDYSSGGEGIAKDYALAFISEVNWQEISEHLEDFIESDEDENN